MKGLMRSICFGVSAYFIYTLAGFGKVFWVIMAMEFVIWIIAYLEGMADGRSIWEDKS